MSGGIAEGLETERIVEDSSGRLFLRLVQDDAAEIIERLRETHADTQGRAFLIHLARLSERLGPKWEVKRDAVFAQLKASFERKFAEPNWCIRINDDSFLAVILTMGEHKGALNAAELWYSTGQFFVGDVSAAPPPLYVAIADDVDRMRLIRIDLNQYFDRAEARPFKAAETPLPTASPEPQRIAPSSIGTMTSIRRPQTVGALLSMGNRQLRVASSVEPVFEMKKLAMIGHRFEPAVMDAGTAVAIDAKALGNLDWNDREQIDVLNIEQGVALLRMRSPEQRKMVMVIPAAFSTFASVKARTRLMPIVSRASQDMGLKVLFEIRHLQGVPAGRIAEVAALLKPYCMTSMGQVPGEPRAIAALKGCGLSGICIDYDGNRRDDAMLETYLAALNTAARSTAGACMIQGFGNLHQMAVARLAGVSHASVKAAALTARA